MMAVNTGTGGQWDWDEELSVEGLSGTDLIVGVFAETDLKRLVLGVIKKGLSARETITWSCKGCQ